MSEGILQFGIKSRDWKEIAVATNSATINATAGRVESTHTYTAYAASNPGLVTFTMTNNRITSNSVVLIVMESSTGANSNLYVQNVVPLNTNGGSCTFSIANNGSGAASVAVFRFFVLNGTVY